MNKQNRLILIFLSLILLLGSLTACINDEIEVSNSDNIDIEEEIFLAEDGEYTDPLEVAEYIKEYKKLPKNYITKNEARDLGWDNKKGNLWDVASGKSIGGDRFGNREGLLPEADGRIYYECDVNYEGGYRGAERIVFSNDGLIFYTEDHYNTFIKLFGDD